ncbi:uncharacterized protein DSM5745_00311 [Aspergillus mulundensis]|uniref:Uncharacterized protein n=1 Tax=Aspergillus mulundensis TaxID=1810919 RepID=A0A3D8T389_9EURO|nr:hypothetical protein DSM5745_00311 [Aspergillus mulundensis]RDW92989.1 hypothetical protein DSM5745_00311 [Aspergillus mulundensis]
MQIGQTRMRSSSVAEVDTKISPIQEQANWIALENTKTKDMISLGSTNPEHKDYFEIITNTPLPSPFPPASLYRDTVQLIRDREIALATGRADTDEKKRKDKVSGLNSVWFCGRVFYILGIKVEPVKTMMTGDAYDLQLLVGYYHSFYPRTNDEGVELPLEDGKFQ